MNESSISDEEPTIIFDPSPIRSSVMAVEPQWIDYNGHLNVAWYQLLFCRGIEEFYTQLDVGEDYLARANGSLFAVEAHLSYIREIKDGDRVVVDNQILDCDDKRLHLFQTLIHADDEFVSATNESMQIHVDMATRRAAPFPADPMSRINACANAQADLPRPERAGRRIGFARR